MGDTWSDLWTLAKRSRAYRQKREIYAMLIDVWSGRGLQNNIQQVSHTWSDGSPKTRLQSSAGQMTDPVQIDLMVWNTERKYTDRAFM